MEDVQSRHRKEVKAWDGEKRAALKKAKALKGKKGKETLASVETEYAEKYEQMQQRHKQELDPMGSDVKAEQVGAAATEATETAESEAAAATAAAATNTAIIQPEESSSSTANNKNNNNNNSKLEKARRKREKQKQEQREKDAAIVAELETVAQSGPSARDAEIAAIQAQLEPLGLCMATIPADGHCLYRAVQAQLLSSSTTTTADDDTTVVVVDDELVWQMRETCANAILDQAHELEAFLEFTDDVPDLQAYVHRVRTRADCWGGHVELRALSTALKRPIHVYQAVGECLVIDDSHCNEKSGNSSSSSGLCVEPIRLSYHLRYYSLGEHYNQVIVAPK